MDLNWTWKDTGRTAFIAAAMLIGAMLALASRIGLVVW